MRMPRLNALPHSERQVIEGKCVDAETVGPDIRLATAIVRCIFALLVALGGHELERPPMRQNLIHVLLVED